MGPGFFKDLKNKKEAKPEVPTMHQFFVDLGKTINAPGSITVAMKLDEVREAREKWKATKNKSDKLAFLILDAENDLRHPFAAAAFQEYIKNDMSPEGATVTDLLIDLLEGFENFKNDSFVWDGE
jgi:hypothetical protein